MILDGEIVAWRHTEDGGHAMPFSEIQKRLGRKQVSEQLMQEVPVAYVVFDVIYAEGELTLRQAAVGTRRDPRPRLRRSAARGAAAAGQRARAACCSRPEIQEPTRLGMGAARPRDARRLRRAA